MEYDKLHVIGAITSAHANQARLDTAVTSRVAPLVNHGALVIIRRRLLDQPECLFTAIESLLVGPSLNRPCNEYVLSVPSPNRAHPVDV